MRKLKAVTLFAVIVLLLSTLQLGPRLATLAQQAPTPIDVPTADEGIITTFAGGYVGDGGPAVAASLDNPWGVAIGTDGALYVADSNNHRIRRIGLDGIITTVAGDGTKGFSGDSGLATAAQLNTPQGVALGPDGALHIADTGNNRIRRVGPDGVITTVAGGGMFSIGDGGPAVGAGLSRPFSLTFGSGGSLFIADWGNHRIRRVGLDGIITTVAGTGTQGFSGDGGPAVSAALRNPSGVIAGPDGVLTIADSNNNRIRRVDADGIITTVAGTGTTGFSGDNGPAVEARLTNPNSVALGPDGTLYIADRNNHRIRRVGLDGIITTVAGNGAQGFSGDGGPASATSLHFPYGVTVGPDGVLYIADSSNNRIRRVGLDSVITTFAGGYTGDGGPATTANLFSPFGVAVGLDGALYIADTLNNRIRRVGLDGNITTVAGNGTKEFSGDSGLATAAQLNGPQGVAFGPDGALYIADTSNNRIRRVGLDGIITTVAGNGTAGFSGDGGLAVAASLNSPRGAVVGPDGALYFADFFNNRIRRVGTDGIITTVAGTGGTGFSGDGGLATAAKIYLPTGVDIGADGALYIADTYNHRIRRVGVDGVITTVAGTGDATFSGDGGLATAARLNFPRGLGFGLDGALYIADSFNNRIRRIGLDGNITTVVGNGTQGFSGDGGPATAAQLALSSGVAVGPDGALYIADTTNQRIRRVPLVEPATVTMALVLEGRPPAPNDRWVTPVKVTIVPAAGGSPVFSGTLITDTSGRFTLNLIPGAYRMRVYGASSLARVVEVTLLAGENPLSLPVLRSGDANQDNVVNITDFSLLAASFGLASAAPAFDARVDFNADGVVNITDFSLLAASFGLAGESL